MGWRLWFLLHILILLFRHFLFYFFEFIMDNLNRQLMDGLYKLFTAKPVDFILQHSLLIGFITGIISLMPFAIKRIPHAVISILAILTAFLSVTH